MVLPPPALFSNRDRYLTILEDEMLNADSDELREIWRAHVRRGPHEADIELEARRRYEVAKKRAKEAARSKAEAAI